MTSQELAELIKQAQARYDTLTPEQKEWHDYEQRRSFARSSCPSDRDYLKWCILVDRIMPPRNFPEGEKTS